VYRSTINTNTLLNNNINLKWLRPFVVLRLEAQVEGGIGSRQREIPSEIINNP
jgi:hypothetical protein